MAQEESMRISDIRVRKATGNEGKLKAYVTITFDDCFVIHNVKVIEGKEGPFIAMPSRRTPAGEYKDVAHPITAEFRTELQRLILEAYDSDEAAAASADAETRTVDPRPLSTPEE
jgi:stage V sporulation protein G